MASIVDSFREVSSDHLAFIKLVVWAIPVYYSYELFANAKGNYSGFVLLASITAFFLFGFLVEVATNVIEERDNILPSLNPLKLGYSAIKCLIAVGPVFLIFYLIVSYLCSLINIVPWVDFALESILWLVVSAITVASFLLFGTKRKILDSYNFVVIYQKSGDLILIILFFIIQLIIINIPTNAFVGYSLLVLFGFGPVFNFYLCFAFVFNVAVTGHYLGQVHYEHITYNMTKDK
ncbi:MAG: hypothetical protein PHC64_09015 [Candidatus Gastranaerophilales bacterium]|nr:hypothetical protein [Candidatus Gastranaerophilales bacterium]